MPRGGARLLAGRVGVRTDLLLPGLEAPTVGLRRTSTGRPTLQAGGQRHTPLSTAGGFGRLVFAEDFRLPHHHDE